MFIRINKKEMFLLIIGILLAILATNMINSVSAADNTNNKTNTNIIVTITSNNNANVGNVGNAGNAANNLVNSTIINTNSKNSTTKNNIKVNSNAKTKNKPKTKIKDGCCSILLQVNASSYVYGYRRDSSYTANLYIKKVKLYGIEALKEYKTTNTYFFHSIIFKNGWYIGVGGSDNPSVNRYLENLGAKMVYKKSITSADMKKAMKKVKSLGIGHFIIKSPEGKVGVVIYNGGSSKLSIFKIKNGEYLSIPNSPRLFRKGIYTMKKSNPVDAAIYVAGTDKFGVNRRNIMIYNITNIKYTNKTTQKTSAKTKIKIWASNDNGKYVGRSTGKKADNIIFNGKKILANSLPKIPNKKYVGEVILN